MDPMRGINPEEAAAYKRLKSRIFTRVSRGKEGVMPGYGEADIIQEQEKQIATLTAERDDYKAHFEVCDANRQQVVIERDALRDATRKVVEAASRWKSAKDSAVRGFSEREPGVMTDFMGASKALLEQSIAMDDLQAALADPVIATLRRE